MASVVWLSVKEGTPARGYWDQHNLERILKDEVHHDIGVIPRVLNEAIVVIPGAYQAPYIDIINSELANLDKCTVFITSDEENNFPIDELIHPDMRIFANYYNPKYNNIYRWVPNGPARSYAGPMQDKIYNWSFSGQVTHPAREAYARILRDRNDGKLIETKGFAQGLEPHEYHKLLAQSKTAPAPSGPLSRDCFRIWEAIEQGAVPIAYDPAFWLNTFPDYPFPVIEEYEQLNGYIDDTVAQYPSINNRIQAWWLQYNRELKEDILGIDWDKRNTTVIVPVSPIKSHPDTRILDETISSIRTQMPYAEIIITFDGVRPENEDRREDYEEFVRRVLDKCYHEWHDVLPIISDDHRHQVGLARKALEYVRTPLVMYVEQDTPLEGIIEWESVEEDLLLGNSNSIRFYHYAEIPAEHGYLMHGMDTSAKSPLMITSQWSQRPHISTTAFYKRVLKDYFSADAKCFIEHGLYGVIETAYREDGILGWAQFRTHIYHPEGNLQRSYHTDGRDGEDNFDATEKF